MIKVLLWFEEKMSAVMNINRNVEPNTGLSPHFFGKCTMRYPITVVMNVSRNIEQNFGHRFHFCKYV